MTFPIYKKANWWQTTKDIASGVGNFLYDFGSSVAALPGHAVNALGGQIGVALQQANANARTGMIQRQKQALKHVRRDPSTNKIMRDASGNMLFDAPKYYDMFYGNLKGANDALHRGYKLQKWTDSAQKSDQKFRAFAQGVGSTVIPVQTFWDALDSWKRYGEFDPGNRARTRLMQQRMGLSPQQLGRYNTIGKIFGYGTQLATIGAGGLGRLGGLVLKRPIGLLSRGISRITPGVLAKAFPVATGKVTNVLATLGATAGANIGAGYAIDQARSWGLSAVRDDIERLQREKASLSEEQYEARAKNIRLKQLMYDTAAGAGKTVAGLSLLPAFSKAAPSAKAAGTLLARGWRGIKNTAGKAFDAWMPAAPYMASQEHQRKSYGNFQDTGDAAIDAKAAGQRAYREFLLSRRQQREGAQDWQLINKLRAIPIDKRTKEQNDALGLLLDNMQNQAASIRQQASRKSLEDSVATRARYLLDRGYGGQKNMAKSSLVGNATALWPAAVQASLFGKNGLSFLPAMGLSTALTNPTLLWGDSDKQVSPQQFDKQLGYLLPLMGKDKQLMSAMGEITAEKVRDAMISSANGEPNTDVGANQLKLLSAISNATTAQQKQEMVNKMLSGMQALDATSALRMVKALQASGGGASINPEMRALLEKGISSIVSKNALYSILQGDFSQVPDLVQLFKLKQNGQV